MNSDKWVMNKVKHTVCLSATDTYNTYFTVCAGVYLIDPLKYGIGYSIINI